MADIHPSAQVASQATIGADAVIGPNCVIGPNVKIGDGVRLIAQVYVEGHTTIGARTVVYPFAALGTPPQSVRYKGEPTGLEIGTDCQIRESVTINIGTAGDRGVTTVGDRCFIMVASHIGHDCQIGNDIIMANNTIVAGHVVVGNNVVFGGQAAIHQFVHIGDFAMVGGVTGVGLDLIPFGMAVGQRARLNGLNLVGLKRRGVSRAEIHRLREAFRMLFAERGGRFDERLEAVTREFGEDDNVQRILAFIRAKRKRPLMPAMKSATALLLDAANAAS